MTHVNLPYISQGFKNHQLVSDVLGTPGLCDLTTNVDFSFLKKYCHGDGTNFILLVVKLEYHLFVIFSPSSSFSRVNFLCYNYVITLFDPEEEK